MNNENKTREQLLEEIGTLHTRVADLEASQADLERANFSGSDLSDTDLSDAEHHLDRWLELGRHGEMEYMRRHGRKRTRPAELVPGTRRIISARMDYLPREPDPSEILKDPSAAFVSRYALGRDYHKLLRRRLQTLAQRIVSEAGPFGYRAFVDSAPVMEKAIAAKAGLGWIGQHCQLITRRFGSWIRLGTVFTDMAHPPGKPIERSFCGRCVRCVEACPADALKGKAWYPGLERKKILDVAACDRWKKENYFQFHQGHNCGICSAVCPYSLKVLKKQP